MQPPASFDGAEYVLGETVLDPWVGYFVLNDTEESVTLQVPPTEIGQTAARGESKGAEGYRLHLRADVRELDLRDTQNVFGFAEGAADGQGPARPRRAAADHVAPPAERRRGRRPPRPQLPPRRHRRGRLGARAHRLARRARCRAALGPRRARRARPAARRLRRARARPRRRGPAHAARRGVRRHAERRAARAAAPAHRRDRGLRRRRARGHLAPPRHVRARARLSRTRSPARPRSPTSCPSGPTSSLDVFDLLGRRVAVLADGVQEAGRYTVRWDGTTGAGAPAANGVYVYRLRAGSFTASHKMVLLR